MDVSSASNLREEVKTEKDVKTEHGVGKKNQKERIKCKIDQKQIREKENFNRAFYFPKEGQDEHQQEEQCSRGSSVLAGWEAPRVSTK